MIAYRSIISLVPNGLRDEIFNIGILIYSDDYLKLDINFDKIHTIKKYLYKDLNIGLIKNIIQDLEDKINYLKKIERIMDIKDIYTGLIRFSDFNGLLVDNLDDELNKLMALYIL